MNAAESYESPCVRVLGDVSEFTQKHGVYFDYGYATQGNSVVPGPGPGVTYS